MNKLYLVFILFFLAFPQTEITVFVDTDSTIVDVIEQNIIYQVIRIFNKKNTLQLSYHYKQVPFANIFKQLQEKNSSNFLSLSTITITKERQKKFLFSSVYIPSNTVIFTLKKNKDNIPWNTKGTRIAYQKNTIHDEIIRDMKTKYGIKPVPLSNYTNIVNSIKSGKLNFAIADNTEIWNENGLHIIEKTETQNGNGIGIMYPKNSLLRDQLEPYIDYYVHSKTFYRFLRETYGSEISLYFRNNLR